jgi:hypothetical protein
MVNLPSSPVTLTKGSYVKCILALNVSRDKILLKNIRPSTPNDLLLHLSQIISTESNAMLSKSPDNIAWLSKLLKEDNFDIKGLVTRFSDWIKIKNNKFTMEELD